MSSPPSDNSRPLADQIARIRDDNARLLQRLEETERRFRAISRGVLRGQETERSRISRDLHDGVGQSLTALKMQLDLLARDAETEASPFAARLASLRDVADAALQEIRQISHAIRPQILDNLGLVPTLRWLVRTFEARTGIAAHLTCDELQPGRDPDVETLLYRITQEALTNVAKHAGAAHVSVALRVEGAAFRLRIEDDGAGFEPRAGEAREDESGFGLQSMRDRVRLFGGRFLVQSKPGAGTVIDVSVQADGAHEVMS